MKAGLSFILLLGLILSACTSSTPAAPNAPHRTDAVAGNGSSSIGNLVFLTPGLGTTLPVEDGIKVVAGMILDADTGERLLAVEQSTSKARQTERGDPLLVPAQLGGVSGFERLSDGRAEAGTAYWIACPESAQCYKLTPLSTSNPKIPEILGALVYAPPSGRTRALINPSDLKSNLGTQGAP